MSRYSPNPKTAARRPVSTAAGAAVIAGAVVYSASAWSAQVPVSDIPLFLGKSTQPNVFFELDDSGSMGRDDLEQELTYSYFDYQDSFEDYYPDGGFFNNDWREDAPVGDALAFQGDPDLASYDPWWDTSYGNSDFTNARDWPVTSSPEYSGTSDLAGSTYIEWVDDAGTTSDPPTGPSDYTSGGDGVPDAWDGYRLFTIKDNEIVMKEVTFSPSSGDSGATSTTTTLSTGTAHSELHGQTVSEVQQRYANWYTYHRTRNHVLLAAVGNLLPDFPDIKFGANSIHNRYFEEMPAQSTDAPYTSHNKSLYTTLKESHISSGGTPLRNGVDRAGEYYAGDLSGRDSPINLECQQNFTLAMTDGFYNSGHSGTGDVDGDGVDNLLADITRHYYETDLASGLADEVPSTVDDPLTGDPQDQQHMVTYGVAFGLTGDLEDTDGDGVPDNDTSGQLAAPFEVDSKWTPGTPSGDETLDDLWHASYNSTGEYLSAQNPKSLTKSMTNAIRNVAERGASAAALAVNAGTVQGDSTFFQAVFNSANWTGNLKAVPLVEETQNGVTILTADESNPSWEAADVNAGLDPGNRTIATYDPSSAKGIPFQWGDLTTAQQNALNTNPDTGSSDGMGEERLDFLRGDRSLEADNGGSFRDRSSIYGDFVNGAPLYVGTPPFLYPEQWPSPGSETSYGDFVQNNKNRDAIVYVGGNDGMLHAFDAETGAEVFNFVPNAVFDDLNELTSQNYSHKFYVDGAPTYADAFFNGSWHSVLVGGLGKGGQGIYALDITDPSQFSESNADDVVLWEFGDEDTSGGGQAANGDADLGLTLSDPSVVRLPNGDWAAVFGNGINNTASDGSSSSTGNAVLYIVDIETGRLIKKIDTGVGKADDPQNNDRPNGLGPPAPVDVDGDSVVEFIYAGDLFGNLWKFDVSSDDPNDWGSFVEQGNDPAPMFTAVSPNNNRQPILTRPEVGEHPSESGRIVYFGTGKYLGQADDSQTGQTTQAFYGVWDRADESGNNTSQTEFTVNDLRKQGILEEQTTTRQSEFDPSETVTKQIRKTSDEDINSWYDGNPNSGKGGWVFYLHEPVGTGNYSDIGDGNNDNRGERVVNDPVLRDQRIIFTTRIPTTNPCDFGGRSYLMELDRETGGRLSVAPFDLNRDRDRGSEDKGNDGTNPAGIMTKKGFASSPAALVGEEGEKKAISNSSGKIEVIDNEPPKRRKGRQSWQELR